MDDFSPLVLTAVADMRASQGFYELLGYRQVETGQQTSRYVWYEKSI